MKLALLVTGVVLAGSFAFAADQEASESTTVDTSKNVITGTQTTKKKYKQKGKDAHGNKMDAEVTETTKVHKDGTVDKSVEVESESKAKK